MHVPSVHHNFRALLALIVTLGLFAVIPFVSHAAEIAVSPSTGAYAVGQSFTVTIQVNPLGKNVNAVESQLGFDRTKLAVTSVSKTGSAFSLWTTEPPATAAQLSTANTSGTISFGGGSPSPFSTRSNLLSVTFRATAEGVATVSVSSGSVLAADGLGTDVYTQPVNGSFTIGPAGTATPTPEPEEEETEDNDSPITFGDPPRAPEAGSTVFLDPEVWYATKVGLFTWEVPFDVDELALEMSTSSEHEPKTVFDPPTEQFAISDEVVTDGIQYLTMQYKNQVGWGAILHRKIMIDTITPEPFTVDVRAGNSPSAFPLLTFEAKDSTSGIQRYEMTIAGGEPVDITPDEARLGYMLKDLVDGTYTVRVIAYDFAGNERESSVAVLITAGWQPPTEAVVTTSIWDFFKGKNLIIILLLLVIVCQFIYSAYTRKQHEQKEQKLRKETREVQDQMEKIFSALRDEIYDQINMITKHERLSKKEKEAVEGLNQALEVSETLIEKEITDVSKILK